MQHERAIDVAADDERLLLAACYLDDAAANRNVPFQTDKVRSYVRYKGPWLSRLLFAVYVVYLLLALFEAPAQDGLLLPLWATVVVEVACLAFFTLRLTHEASFTNAKTFWTDSKHIVLVVILSINLLDIIVFTAMTYSGLANVALRVSRPLRPFVIVNFTECRSVRLAFRNVRRTLPEVANVLFLFAASVALFALMAFKLFGTKNQLAKVGGRPYFRNYLDSAWDLYVLVTTANHPDIMMPAYEVSRWFALFYVAFLVVNLYIFINVFLAVVYNRFRSNLKLEVVENKSRNEMLMNSTFRLTAGTDEDYIKMEPFLSVISLAFPSRGKNYAQTLWWVLDPHETGRVDAKGFTDLLSLSKLVHCDLCSETVLQRCIPQLYNSKPSRIVISIVKSKMFRHFFDVLILINTVCIACSVEYVENAFITAFLLEVLLKVYAFGVTAFFRKLWNIFDAVVVAAALIATIVYSGRLDSESEQASNSSFVVDFLLVLRMVRIFKVFHSFRRFRIVLNTIQSLLPSASTYGGMLITILYAFAIVGMEIFGGKIRSTSYNNQSSSLSNCGNDLLKGSDFVRNRYCSNNFNDLSSSFVLLFELLVVNQWHILVEGHVLVTSKWARIYFVSFHVVCVIITLSIFTAFVLEAFTLEYYLSKRNEMAKAPTDRSPLCSRLSQMGLVFGKVKASSGWRQAFDMQRLLTGFSKEDEVDADHDGLDEDDEGGSSVTVTDSMAKLADFSSRTSIRFVLAKRSKSIQELLQRMFDKELVA